MKLSAKRITFDHLVAALLPIAFVGAGFLNMWAFVLDGHRHEWFRQGLVLGVQGIAAICFFVKVCLIFHRKRELRKPILLTSLVVAVFGVVYLWAIFIRDDKGLLLREAVINGAYLVSACCVVIIIVSENCLAEFLRTCRNYALALSPVVIYYCVRFYLPSAEYGVNNFGLLSYMPLAYCLMEFCIFLLLRPLLEYTKKPAPAFPKLEFALYTLFSIAITLSGTKGTILCLIWGGFLAFVYAAVVRRGARCFGAFAISALLSVVLFSTALMPNYGDENRVVFFLKELMNPESTEVSMESIQETADIIQKVEPPADDPQTPPVDDPQMPPTDEPQTPPVDEPQENEPAGPLTEAVDVVEFFASGKAAEALASGEITQEEYDTLNEMRRKMENTATGGRKALWIQAVSEIKVAPLTGQGPLFYHMKYGTYPHNFFLELATDFGVPVMLLILALGIFVFIRLMRLSLHSSYYLALTLYVMAFLPRMMISGSLYSYAVFFQYGFCILLAFQKSLFSTEKNG